jgi:hypothetical protein
VRHLATHAAAAIAGALLALLLTSNVTSRQASAPRPAPSEYRRLVSTERTEVPTPVAPVGFGPSATPTTSSGAASATAATDPVPTVAPTPKPKPTKRPRATTRTTDGRRGVASWVAASYGADYLAARLPRGTRLRICGPVGCVTGTVNDYGPSKRIHPDRIVDLSRHDFSRVCGHPETLGVCRVRVERLR